ncbi:unnamed protein product [Cylindrotheca closterium]|uniref:non-specific serine/threonine protein kinase n=1 Tax=Cylindrotheca closterium TaxID=2856 RepID=A0AAD2JGG3_9STRA|nr:unnamed protein product [Cylindrotheca closterium]
MMHPYNETDPEIVRRRAIQQIYFDNTLTPSQKHERILAIQERAHDSDSDNMSIFTEGTGVKSPKGSVTSNNSGRGRSRHDDTPKSTNSSVKSSKSNKSTKTNSNKTSKKVTRSAKPESKLSKKEEETTPTTATATSIITPQTPQKATSFNSLSKFDASPDFKQRQQDVYDGDLYQQHIAPPMEDVESVVVHSQNGEEEEAEEDGMKIIPLDGDDEETPLQQQKYVPSENIAHPATELTEPEDLNKTRSNGTKTQSSDTEPASYNDSASMDSSIDTQEQNKDMMNNEAIDDKMVKSFTYRKKRACAFFVCSMFLLAALIAPLVYFNRDWFAENLKPLSGSTPNQGESNDGSALSSNPPNEKTDMPTSSPTKEYLYDPPNAQDCQDIANGNFPLQNGWILRRFQVPMDVNLQYETTDVDTMATMLVSHLQSDLAPILAGCDAVVGESFLRRRLVANTRFVIGNAIMSAWHESDDVCATQKRTCYRVMVEISLFVQGTKTNTSFQNLVTDVLEAGGDGSLVSQLDLPSPFDDIKVRGVFPTFTTESPTTRPSMAPTVPITPSPTTAPVVPATPNPTIEASAQPTVTPTPRPTAQPTLSPTAEAVDCKSTLQQVLANSGVTQLDDNAFQWMQVDQWRCNGNQNSIVDRYALASLYLSLGGEQWSRKTQWMSATSVCQWQGVGCDANSIAVTSLQLGDNQLSGAMPIELSLLTKLTNLDLDTNGLGSRILPELANLVELTNLNLANNALTGQVPDTFSSLVKLESLKADSNQMQGRLTTQIGQMTRLLELSLSANKLSGNIPTEIGMLSILQRLNLSSNKFSSMPDEISQLTSLRSFEISSNKMKGEIPELSSMAQLTLLRLDNNKLSGDIPPLPSSLSTCNLTKNKFKGNTKNGEGVCILN